MLFSRKSAGESLVLLVLLVLLFRGLGIYIPGEPCVVSD